MRRGPATGDWRAGERVCDGAGHERSAADSGRDFYCRITLTWRTLWTALTAFGAHGLVAGLAYALTGWMVNLPWLALAGVAVAGALRRSCRGMCALVRTCFFLGDAGSYVLGAALGAMAVGAWFADVPFLLSLLRW